MRFYGRETELETLGRIREASLEESRFTAILGKRRIGKTSLMLESVDGHRYVYLFIQRLNEAVLVPNLLNTVSEAGIDIPGSPRTFGELLRSLLIHSRTEPLTVIIDEFQELFNVDKSIYGDIQNVWDTYRDGSHMNLIVSGSVHSMMVRLFEDEKEPLFNRPTSKIELKSLPLSLVRDILLEHNPLATGHDMLTLFLLTGGVPFYMAVLMDSGLTDSEKMMRGALSMGSVFLRDGRDILISEFGKDYRTYFSIMQLISSGRERRGEIDDILKMDVGAYLERLDREYDFAKQTSPILSRPNSRNSRWVVSDMYLRFYFRYIQPNFHYVEAGRFDLLQRAVYADLDEYEGRVLEDFFRRRISEEWIYTDIGGYWSRDGKTEIDIIVLDDILHKAEVIEVKRNPEKINLGVLERKCDVLSRELSEYEVGYSGLSMDDVL